MRHQLLRTFCLIMSAFTLSSLVTSVVLAEVTFDWVTVGDVGNEPDSLVMTKCPGSCVGDDTTGYGSVDYEFQIATTHVTTAQYTEFLNSVDPVGENSLKLYDSRMETFLHPVSGLNKPAYAGGIAFDGAATDGSKYSVMSGQSNYPASWVSWVSAARFVNWLSNGQGAGDTETGVYNEIPASTNDPLPFREDDSTFFLPTEDEFYKAAYYDPTKNGGGYWEYGTQSDTPPTSEGPVGGTNSANYAKTDGTPGPSGDTFWQDNGEMFDDDFAGYRTDVGAYTNSTSHYGLHDVEGLSYQWMEGYEPNQFNARQELPIFRGGAWFFGSDGSGAAYRNGGQFFATGSSSLASNYHGIRIAGFVDVVIEEGLAGDYNDDGTVDLADFTVWRDNLNAADESSLNGNGDGLNGVDDADYTLWANNFGMTSNTAAVPEPSGLALMLFGMVAAGALRRRERS